MTTNFTVDDYIDALEAAERAAVDELDGERQEEADRMLRKLALLADGGNFTAELYLINRGIDIKEFVAAIKSGTI